MKADKYVCVLRILKRGSEGRGGLREDKGRSRSKNSIISPDARTSLGFPGADNGALFEGSFRARDRDTRSLPVSLPSAFPLTHPPLPVLSALFSLARAFSFVPYRMKIQSCERKRRNGG